MSARFVVQVKELPDGKPVYAASRFDGKALYFHDVGRADRFQTIEAAEPLLKVVRQDFWRIPSTVVEAPQ